MSIKEELDLLLDLRMEHMDLEYDRKIRKKEEAVLYKWMEQEAEPEGGPVSDMYADKITYVQNIITDIDIKMGKIMKKIEEIEQN